MLSVQGVKDAIANGANALETDWIAWHDESGDGWWANHDGVVANRSATASELFEAIAKQRIAGKNIAFVRFDLKNPDYYKLDYPEYVNCSIVALQDLARKILHPAGACLASVVPLEKHTTGYARTRTSMNLSAWRAHLRP